MFPFDPQPVSDPVHDGYVVFSILRALDQVDALKSVDNAAKNAIFQYWHDVPILRLQGHLNLQNGLAWYIVGNLTDHPQKSLAHEIVHPTWHPEVSG